MQARVLASMLLLATMAGCSETRTWPTHVVAAGTDESLPGVVVVAQAWASQDVVRVEARAWNNGTTTWKVQAVCSDPWSLRFEGTGEQYSEAQCAAYGPPADWPPGASDAKEFVVERSDFGWEDQDARLVVSFGASHPAAGSGVVRVPLDLGLP